MWDGPYYVVERPGYTARMLIGHEPPETVEDADVHVHLSDGTCRYASLMTTGAITKVLQRHRQTGETADGAYFWCTDLVVVPEAGVPAMIRALDELVRSGDIQTACQQIPVDDED